jgi:hypothetical protein
MHITGPNREGPLQLEYRILDCALVQRSANPFARAYSAALLLEITGNETQLSGVAVVVWNSVERWTAVR